VTSGFTEAEYLALESAGETKHEFVNGATAYRDEDAMVELAALGGSIRLREIYAGIDLNEGRAL
jgi:hypothetical protein